jgi:hypothetical protein
MTSLDGPESGGSSFLQAADVAVGSRSEQERSSKEVNDALLTRLLAESPTAEVMHVVLAALMGVLFWPHVARVALLLWLVSIVAATATRLFIRHRLVATQAEYSYAIRMLRAIVVVTGLAWAVGPAVVVVDLPFEHLALLMVVFAGFVAGGTHTLVADARSFYGLTAALMGPLALSILAAGYMRLQVIAFLLGVLFGAGGVLARRGPVVVQRGSGSAGAQFLRGSCCQRPHRLRCHGFRWNRPGHESGIRAPLWVLAGGGCGKPAERSPGPTE